MRFGCGIGAHDKLAEKTAICTEFCKLRVRLFFLALKSVIQFQVMSKASWGGCRLLEFIAQSSATHWLQQVDSLAAIQKLDGMAAKEKRPVKRTGTKAKAPLGTGKAAPGKVKKSAAAKQRSTKENLGAAAAVKPGRPAKPTKRKRTKPASKSTISKHGAPSKELKLQAGRVVRQLRKDYAHAVCALNYETPTQLLVATILSAQCTDVRVNIVTKGLFGEYPTAADMADASIESLESLVQSTGFYRNKAKNIKSCCTDLVEEYGGEVPQDLDALVQLAGVGRKTANVVLGTAFGIPTGVVVDTHVGRISRRVGLTSETDPVKAERDLIGLLPKKEWIDYSHRMIYHGRETCKARKPQCDGCSFERFCPQVGVE